MELRVHLEVHAGDLVVHVDVLEVRVVERLQVLRVDSAAGHGEELETVEVRVAHLSGNIAPDLAKQRK